MSWPRVTNSSYKRGLQTKNKYTRSSRIFTDKLESLMKSFKEKVDWWIGCTKISLTVYNKGCQNVLMSDNNKNRYNWLNNVIWIYHTNDKTLSVIMSFIGQ